MAKFEVVNLVTTRQVMSYKNIRDENDNLMRIKVYKEDKNFKPGAYGCEDIKVGQTIEIKDELLAEKARKNPDFKEVTKKSSSK